MKVPVETKGLVAASLQVSLARLLLRKGIITGEELKKEIMDVTELSEKELIAVLETMAHEGGC